MRITERSSNFEQSAFLKQSAIPQTSVTLDVRFLFSQVAVEDGSFYCAKMGLRRYSSRGC